MTPELTGLFLVALGVAGWFVLQYFGIPVLPDPLEERLEMEWRQQREEEVLRSAKRRLELDPKLSAREALAQARRGFSGSK